MGDRSYPWKHTHAVAVERDDVGRPTRMRLLTDGGRKIDVGLPDDVQLSAAATSFVQARVPAHDPATHGPLDASATMPAWTIVALACAVAVVLAWAFHLSIGVHFKRCDTRLLATLAIVGPVGWLLAVGPFLTRRQRDTAFACLLLAVMTTTSGSGLALWLPHLRHLANDLQAIPAADRARVSATIHPHADE